MAETLDIKDFSSNGAVAGADRLLLARSSSNYFAGAISVDDFKSNYLDDKFATKGIKFNTVELNSDGSFSINYATTPYAKIVLTGSNTVFPITVSNYNSSSNGKIMVFLTGGKKLSMTNMLGTITMPSNTGTVILIDYYSSGGVLYAVGQTILGDITILSPDPVIDFISTYSDNIVCQLLWTAPKSNIDDDLLVDEFDIRYSNSLVDTSVLATWNSLKKIENIPTPLAPGTLLSMTVSNLKANQQYYIYIRSIKVTNSIPYYSLVAGPILFNTSTTASETKSSFMINITSDNIHARTKTTNKDTSGNFTEVDYIVDEKELNKFTTEGLPDLTNKSYNTAWGIYKYGRDGTCFNIIIDLYNIYLIDKIYLFAKDKGKCAIYGMKDYGYLWETISELYDIYFNSWYTINFEFRETRFIKIAFDLLTLGANGVDGFNGAYYNGDLFSIYNLLIYGISVEGIPDLIKPPKRRYVQLKSFDKFLCMNGHFYQDGRIHSMCSGPYVRLFGAGGHFCAFDNNNTLLEFDTIDDLRFRMNRIPWVSSNNMTGEYLLNNLLNSYKAYDLSPYISFSSVLDWCKYGGSSINRPVDQYWYPNQWMPVPKALVRGADDMLAVTSVPSSYRTYGKCAYTFAAKYGKNEIDNPLDFIWTSPDYAELEPMDTGLNLLCGLEMNNEPDLNWSGQLGYTLPEENAALLSALYDGNNTSLISENGSHLFGSKNADLDFLVISGGTAGCNIGWFLNIILRARSVRSDAKVPVDVFAFHNYSSTAGDLGSSTSGNVYAIPFEELLLIRSGAEITNFLDFRDRFAPTKEVWINEFGYGEAGILGTSSKYLLFSKRGRLIDSMIIPDRHRGDIKGAMLIRAAITMMGIGVTMLNYYGTECESDFFHTGVYGAGAGTEMFKWQEMTDTTIGAKVDAIEQYECPYSRGGFAAMGIFGNLLTNGAYPITQSYWWISTFRNRLKDYVFTGYKNHSSDSKIIIACFKHSTLNKGAYVVYYNDSINTGITDVLLSIPTGNSKITKVVVTVPKTQDPSLVPTDLATDQLRTGMPTARHEIYQNGEWVLNNKPIYGTTYASYTNEPAIYPSNPIEGLKVVTLPSLLENSYFPLVGPVAGRSSAKFNGSCAANQYINEINTDGIISYEVKGSTPLAWRLVDAICDFLDFSSIAQTYKNGIESEIDVVTNVASVNITEFPDIYLFDGEPTTSFISVISELSVVPINSQSVKLYWNNNNVEDTGYDVFMSDLPESGYTLHSTIPVSDDNSVIIAGLNPNSTYYFKIRAKRENSTGIVYGDLSESISGTTYQYIPTPYNLTYSNLLTSSVTISWEYTNEQLTDFIQYDIYRAKGVDSYQLVGSISDKAIRTYNDNGLLSGILYYYKIRAIGTNGKSEYSNILSVKTLTPEEAPPIVKTITTDKLGNKIILEFNIQLDDSPILLASSFILTENGNNRLVTNAIVDSSNKTRVLLSVNSSSLSEYSKNLPIKLSYSNGSLISTYGVNVSAFTNLTVKNVIGNFINLNAIYKLNITYSTSPIPDINLFWNNMTIDYTIVNKALTFTNIFDSYGMPTDISVGIPYSDNVKVDYNNTAFGKCSILAIPSEVYGYGVRGTYNSNDTENKYMLLNILGLDNSYKYTINAFGSLNFVGGGDDNKYKLLKMKIGDLYSLTIALTLVFDESGYMTIEDISPINNTIETKFITDIPASVGALTQYPFLSYLLVHEYTPSTEENNKSVFIRECALVGAEDTNITTSSSILLHLNLYGIATSYRISESEELLASTEWFDIPDSSTMNIPFNLSSGFGAKTIYVQTKNLYNESNVKLITITYNNPYIPLVLSNIYINNNSKTTYNNIVSVLFEFNGTPTHYKISELSDLSTVEWVDWGSPSNNTVSYTMTDTAGDKTLYVILSDSVGTSSVKSDSITYDIPKIIEFDIAIPSTIDKTLVTAEIPALKFNKKLAFSYVTDDTNSIYQHIFSPINKRYKVTDFPNSNGGQYIFHLNEPITSSTVGYYPTKYLQCTDGAGLNRRYATTVATWPNKLKDLSIGLDVGRNWPWISEKEFKMFKDFGFTLAYHDLVGDAAPTSLAEFDTQLINTISLFTEYVEITPKIMIEPNGNHSFIDYSQGNSTILAIVALSGDSRIKLAYPYKSNASLDKDDITILRIFAYGTLSSTSDITAEYPTNILSRLSELNAMTDYDLIYWLIGASHAGSNWETELFDAIHTLYGDTGLDNLWVPSIDEMYEYWFIRKYASIEKTITSTGLHFKLKVPNGVNFAFNEISLLLSNITQLDNITITPDNNIYGLSYAINDLKLLVNINYDNVLLTRAEKYTAILEASPNSNYLYGDAIYFALMLRTDLSLSYISRIETVATSPTLTDITVPSSSYTTDVTVLISSTGATPTHYMISENSLFTNAEWVTYVDTFSYQMSEGIGTKTIYLKIKNIYGESSTVTKTILLLESPLSISAISVNSGATLTGNSLVSVSMTFLGTPTHYMISESSTFESASWIQFESPIQFQLSLTYGLKTIYVKLKNNSEETPSINSTIELIESTVLTSISLSNAAATSTSKTVSVGITYTGGTPTHYRLAETEAGLTTWITYSTDITYTFTSLGDKTLYVQIKNSANSSDILNDTITIVEAPVVVLFANVASAPTSTSVGYVNKILRPMYAPNLSIKDLTGANFCSDVYQQYSGSNIAIIDALRLKWGITNEDATASEFYWSAPTLPAQTGTYPNSLIYDGVKTVRVYRGVRAANGADQSVHYLSGVPSGTYTVKMLLSSASRTDVVFPFKIRFNNLIITISDATNIINNNSYWYTFDPVTITDGYMLISQYADQALTDALEIYPIIMVEITKTA